MNLAEACRSLADIYGNELIRSFNRRSVANLLFATLNEPPAPPARGCVRIHWPLGTSYKLPR